MKKTLSLTSLFLSLIFLSISCGSGKKLSRTFFVGEEGIQYFIKPLSFLNAPSKRELSIDFTFRHKEEVKDSTIVNFDLFSPDIIKKIAKIEFTSGSGNAQADTITLLYKERVKNKFKSRFSSGFLLKDLVKLFKSNDWKVVLYTNGEQQTFLPSKATQKKIEQLNNEIFVLLEE